MNEKKIWLLLNSNISEVENNEEKEIKAIVIPTDIPSKQIKLHIMNTLGLQQDNVVVKLRNHLNRLVPINGSIPINAPSRPYTLDICHVYQSVKPTPRTVSVATFEHVLQRKMQNILTRLDTIEGSLPQLPEIRQNKLTKEISDISEVMNFLDNKIKKADECQWQGMFEKNPLW